MYINRFFIFPTYDKLNGAQLYIHTKEIFVLTSIISVLIEIADSIVIKEILMAYICLVIFKTLKDSIRNISAFIRIKRQYNTIIQNELKKSKDKTIEKNNKRFEYINISNVRYSVNTSDFYLIYLYPNHNRTYFMLEVINLNLDLKFNINAYSKFRMFKIAMNFYLILLYVSNLLALCIYFICLFFDPIFAVIATCGFSIIDKFILDLLHDKLKLERL